MKLKYLLSSLLVGLSLVAVGCQDQDEMSTLSDIKVSQSYVALPVNGGTSEITIDAKGPWELVSEDFMNTEDGWLTVSPTSGAAGSTTLKFTAPSTVSGRGTVSIKVKSGDQTQIINVIQGLKKADPSTAAQVIAGPDGKTYQVTGVCTSIANTTYGNWYIEDATGSVYVYGTLDKTGAEKNFSSLGIEVGDVVTVEGPKTTYGSTIELVNVTVINIEKSLVKLDSLHIDGVNGTEAAKAGSKVEAFLTCKGDGLSVVIPEAAKSWLTISGIEIVGETAKVTMNAAANVSGGRSSALKFVTTKSGKEYSSEAVLTQEGSITEATVADLLAAEDNVDAYYYVTGVITSVNNLAKGRFDVSDHTGTIYAYNIMKSKDDTSTDLSSTVKLGDVVKLCVYKTSYGTTKEIVGYVMEVTTPYTATGAIALCKSGSIPTEKVYISGKISKIDSIDTGSYGNATYFISDDGTEANQFEVYRGYGLGGAKFTNAGDLKVGDTVLIYGNVTLYGEIAETKSGASIVLYTPAS